MPLHPLCIRGGALRTADCLSVCLSVAYIASNSKTASRKKFKFGRNVAQGHTCDSWSSFEIKTSKLKVTRSH